MLNIYFGEMPEAIYNTNVYFNNTKDIIKAVDKSDVIDENTIMSPLFGNMSPKRLSGGVKTLILICFDKKNIFNASTCGENCSEWILRIAQKRKVVINLHHLMDFGPKPFKAKILNTNKIVKNMAELVFEAGEFV